MIGRHKLYLLNVARAYSNMQDGISDTLDLNKRQMCSGQYDTPPPPHGETWDQLQQQAKARQQLKQITNTVKSEHPKAVASNTEPYYSQEGMNMTIPKSEDVVKSSEGSGMETDQAEQLHALLINLEEY